MATKHRQAKAKNHNTELSISELNSDSPLLPIEQLERLQSFRPDLIDWVVEQTTKEAEHRRSETSKINRFVFIERLVGQALALVIGSGGVVGGSYVALSGEPTAGAAIATVTIGTLAVAFLTRHKTDK